MVSIYKVQLHLERFELPIFGSVDQCYSNLATSALVKLYKYSIFINTISINTISITILYLLLHYIY